MKPKPRTIGKLSGETGIPVETIRFYERTGLIEKPGTTRAGYRIYSREDVVRLRFIRRAKDLGFTLAEIAGLLALNHRNDCEEVRKIAEGKLRRIEERIRDLKRLRKALREIVLSCFSKEENRPCPILETFSRDPGPGDTEAPEEDNIQVRQKERKSHRPR